jgi:hypothetical protein
MRSVNLVYEKPEDIEKIRDDLKVYSPENILIQAFCGISDMETVSGLWATWTLLFPGTAIIGASSAGEIVNAQVKEKSIVISLTAFDHSRVRSMLIRQNDDLAAGGKKMGKALKKSSPKAAIAALDTGPSSCFDHRDPEIVEWLGNRTLNL